MFGIYEFRVRNIETINSGCWVSGDGTSSQWPPSSISSQEWLVSGAGRGWRMVRQGYSAIILHHGSSLWSQMGPGRGGDQGSSIPVAVSSVCSQSGLASGQGHCWFSSAKKSLSWTELSNLTLRHLALVSFSWCANVFNVCLIVTNADTRENIHYNRKLSRKSFKYEWNRHMRGPRLGTIESYFCPMSSPWPW